MWLRFCVLLLAGSVVYFAFTTTPVEAAKLKLCSDITRSAVASDQILVGVRDAPPFVETDDIRGLHGLSIDLWESIAMDLTDSGLISGYAYVECPLGEQIDRLEDGSLDIVISPLTVTSERLARFDMSHQYASSGLTVARRRTEAINYTAAAKILKSALSHNRLIAIALGFAALNLFLAAVIRHHWVNSEHAPRASGKFSAFMQYGFEAGTRTTGLRGISDKFETMGGRLIELFMIVIGTAISALLVSLITTSFVGSMGQSGDVDAQDLGAYRIGTLADSTAMRFVERQVDDTECTATQSSSEPACRTVRSWQDAMSLLADGEVDLVVGDWLQLSYLARSDLYGEVDVQSKVMMNEPYGWGLSRDRDDNIGLEIDRGIVQRLRSPEWRSFVERYLGDGSISPE